MEDVFILALIKENMGKLLRKAMSPWPESLISVHIKYYRYEEEEGHHSEEGSIGRKEEVHQIHLDDSGNPTFKL